LTSRGGGTESSKLKSGGVEFAFEVDAEVAVELVVDRGGGFVAEDAVRGAAVETLLVEMLLVVGFRGVAVRSEALHALRVTMPATRTLLARFPTRRTLGNTDAYAAIGSSNRQFAASATKLPLCPDFLWSGLAQRPHQGENWSKDRVLLQGGPRLDRVGPLLLV
jgi:hypothetical protein